MFLKLPKKSKITINKIGNSTTVNIPHSKFETSRIMIFVALIFCFSISTILLLKAFNTTLDENNDILYIRILTILIILIITFFIYKFLQKVKPDKFIIENSNITYIKIYPPIIISYSFDTSAEKGFVIKYKEEKEIIIDFLISDIESLDLRNGKLIMKKADKHFELLKFSTSDDKKWLYNFLKHYAQKKEC